MAMGRVLMAVEQRSQYGAFSGKGTGRRGWPNNDCLTSRTLPTTRHWADNCSVLRLWDRMRWHSVKIDRSIDVG